MAESSKNAGDPDNVEDVVPIVHLGNVHLELFSVFRTRAFLQLDILALRCKIGVVQHSAKETSEVNYRGSFVQGIFAPLTEDLASVR